MTINDYLPVNDQNDCGELCDYLVFRAFEGMEMTPERATALIAVLPEEHQECVRETLLDNWELILP